MLRKQYYSLSFSYPIDLLSTLGRAEATVLICHGNCRCGFPFIHGPSNMGTIIFIEQK